MFSEQYLKSDFLFDTLKWNNKIDFKRKTGKKERKSKRERERQ